MRPISDTRLNILLILSDDRGHTHGEISQLLGPKDKDRPGKKKGYDGYDKGNLTKTLNDWRIVCGQNNHYYILSNMETLAYIMNHSTGIDSVEFYKQFLKSNYINKLIKLFGLKSVISEISSHLNDRYFREVAIPALLSCPATAEEYKILLKSIDEYFSGMENIAAMEIVRKKFEQDYMHLPRFNPASNRYKVAAVEKAKSYDGSPYSNKTGNIDELITLRDLGIEGVRFYRNAILHDIVSLFKSRTNNSENNKFILKYIELDNHLSPFTAYPVNQPIEIMLSTSFARLYDDAYLIDPKDIFLLLDRANIIFENFPYLVRIFTGSRTYKDAAIRGLIHDWNIASAIFEAIINLLGQLSFDKEELLFHLTRDDAGFQIVDMKTDQGLLGEADLETLDADNLNRGFHEFDQTKYMRPVLLGTLGQNWHEKLVPIESIIAAAHIKSLSQS